MTTAILVIIFAAVVFLAVAVIDLAWALPLFLLLLPTYFLRATLPLPGLALPITLLEVLLLILFAVWLFHRGRVFDWRGQLEPWLLPITLLLTGAIFGTLVSPDWRAALGVLRAYFLEPLLLFVVASDLLKEEKIRERSLNALALIVGLIGLVAIYQKFTGWNIPNPAWQVAETRRVTALYGYPNAIALFCVPIALLCVGRIMSFQKKHLSRTKIVRITGLASAALLGALATLFAVSEGGLIALAAGLLTLGLFYRRTRLIALSAVIVGCLIVSLVPPARDWASHLISLRDDSTSVRTIVWQESFDMLKDHPIFGAGLAGYKQTLVPYHQAKHIEIFLYPHNLVMNFWSEIGVLGLLGFLWVLGLAIVQRVRQFRAAPHDWRSAAVLAVLVALLVHGLVDVPYFKNDLAMLFWFMLAL